MDMLNDYLKRLLSSCSDELRLEPDKNPFLVSNETTTDVAHTPLMGTQISSMVFPLIPAGVKMTLPNRSEVEFVHPHSLGNFNFHVQKSSAGFIVTIRPLLTDSNGSISVDQPLSSEPPAFTPEPFVEDPSVSTAPETPYEFIPDMATAAAYDLESSSFGLDATNADVVETATMSEVIYDEKPAQEWQPSDSGPDLEVISFNDPAYQTVFSDTASYEPPGRRDDFEPDASAPQSFEHNVASQEFFSNAAQGESIPVADVPAEASFVAAAPNAAEAARMDVLFEKMAAMGASDLHLSVSMAPLAMPRINCAGSGVRVKSKPL